jgi:predicted dehydrogenase
MAILGAGTIAHKMAVTIQMMPSVELYAIASRSEERARTFASQHGFPKTYSSYESMLADDAVDLVYIAVPHSHHFKYMKLCLEAGKPVLCEKPFTVNAEQAQIIIKLAKQKHLFVAEAIWTRYMPSRKIIKDIISSGVVGEVASLTANLGYELSNIERIWDQNLAGGALLDVGCYLIHFAKMVLDEEISNISAEAVFRKGVDAIDTISLTFGKSKLATMQCSVVSNSNRRGAIFGTKGYIEVSNINNPELIEVFDADHQKVATYNVPKQITGFEYEVEACLRAIEQNSIECEAMPHSEIVSVLSIMDKIRENWGYELPLIV